MADTSTSAIECVFSFGPFRFFPARQLLLENERAVRIGSRALEILAALVERPGELVSKGELTTRVWPCTIVEESNLKVNVAALRRALGEGQPGRRFVATVPGRGYRFVASVEISELGAPRPRPSAQVKARHNLPASVTRTIGRAETIRWLLDELPHSRLVTVVGAGGIGKTTVALAAAEALIDSYSDGIRFVDFAPLRDPGFAPGALASALGHTIHSGGLIAYLRDMRMLVVFDSCEHVIEGAAALAEQILVGAPEIHILATSREPLRAKGERVHRLSPLATPPASSGMTARKALAYPAVQLFVERAAASRDDFELTDADAPIVAEICRNLEGVALAIELAATRVDAFSLRELMALLDDRFQLLKQERRGDLCRRHRTLAATLDWSFEFLPEAERIILRRLSVFAAAFTLESAMAVAAGDEIAASDVTEGAANLVAKSLVSADVSGPFVHYRLLDTTRAYAWQKFTQSGGLPATLRRHAEHHRDLLQRAAVEWEGRPTAEWLSDYGRKIDDVRSALNWSFSAGGDVGIGAALTVAAIPLWMHLSLLDECCRCVERAIASRQEGWQLGERDEMKLHAALGAALLYARGPLSKADAAWTQALQIAERINDGEYQLRVLWGLSVYRIYVGKLRAALELSERFRAIAAETGDRAARISVDRLSATALHYLGDQAGARRQLDRMLNHYVAPVHRSHIARFQLDQRAAALGTLSHVLWLQGYPEQAIRAAESALEHARASDHALSLSNALVYAACPIALYLGDLPSAERWLAMLMDHLAKHGTNVWNALGHCLKGTLLVKRGDEEGVSLLRHALDELREARFRLRYPAYLGTLAEGLAANGQMSSAHAVIEEALEWSVRNDERWSMAEILRIKGELIRLDGSAGAQSAAEEQYRQALQWARSQGALSWELRAAMSLARLWRERGMAREANDLLSPVYDRFSEGFETSDLKAARSLIEQLSEQSQSLQN